MHGKSSLRSSDPGLQIKSSGRVTQVSKARPGSPTFALKVLMPGIGSGLRFANGIVKLRELRLMYEDEIIDVRVGAGRSVLIGTGIEFFYGM
jgi:hypothetical protein